MYQKEWLANGVNGRFSRIQIEHEKVTDQEADGIDTPLSIRYGVGVKRRKIPTMQMNK